MIGGRFEDWDEERFRSDTYCGCGGRVDRTDFCFLDIRFFTSIHLKIVFFLPVVLMLLVIVDRFRSYCLRDEELSLTRWLVLVLYDRIRISLLPFLSLNIVF